MCNTFPPICVVIHRKQSRKIDYNWSFWCHEQVLNQRTSLREMRKCRNIRMKVNLSLRRTCRACLGLLCSSNHYARFLDTQLYATFVFNLTVDITFMKSPTKCNNAVLIAVTNIMIFRRSCGTWSRTLLRQIGSMIFHRNLFQSIADIAVLFDIESVLTCLVFCCRSVWVPINACTRRSLSPDEAHDAQML